MYTVKRAHSLCCDQVQLDQYAQLPSACEAASGSWNAQAGLVPTERQVAPSLPGTKPARAAASY